MWCLLELRARALGGFDKGFHLIGYSDDPGSPLVRPPQVLQADQGVARLPYQGIEVPLGQPREDPGGLPRILEACHAHHPQASQAPVLARVWAG